MMLLHTWSALVTIAALLLCLGMGIGVARARMKSGVMPPAMTGDVMVERAIRVHYNTLEWIPLFLGGLWLFSLYWNDRIAAMLGVVWILGRVIYAAGYMAAPERRGPGFLIQALATLVLLLGAAGRIIYVMVVLAGQTPQPL